MPTLCLIFSRYLLNDVIISHINLVPKTLSSFKWRPLWHFFFTLALYCLIYCTWMCYLLKIFKSLSSVPLPSTKINPRYPRQAVSTHCRLAVGKKLRLIWLRRAGRTYAWRVDRPWCPSPFTSCVTLGGFCNLPSNKSYPIQSCED